MNGPIPPDHVLDRRRNELVAEFTAWARDHAPSAEPSDVEVALDWKLTYADAELTTWTVADLGEFALSWCPRKLSLPAGEVGSFLSSLGEFFVFLAARGVLEGAGPEQLRSWCARHAGEVERAMSDPANFGMAKRLMSGVGGLDGIPADRDAVEAMASRLNDLDPDEIDDLLLSGDPDLVDLPPVRRPAAEEIAASAARAPVITQMERLAEFCAPPGRTLTKKGNPRVADAVALAGRLDVEEQIGRHARAVRSIEDLPELEWLLRVALRARVVRRVRGKLVAVAAWSRLDVPAKLDRVADAALLEGLTPGVWGYAADEIADALDPHISGLLLSLVAAFGSGEPLEADDLCGALAEALLGPVETWMVRSQTWATRRVLDRLECCGLVAQTDVERGVDDLGLSAPVGGTVVLTPAGVAVVVRWLGEAGLEVPDLPDPTTASASDLLALVGRLDPEQWQRETAAWAAARGDAAAVEFGDALADPAREASQVLSTLSFVEGALGDDAATVTVARLLQGRWDGVAAMWLADRGDTSHVDADPRRALHGMVDLLTVTLDEAGPEEMVAHLPAGASTGLLEDMWRLDHDRVPEVLEVVGRHHPDKATAKAARRSLAKLRSRARPHLPGGR